MAQRWYQKASVQVAIVVGIFSLFGVGINIWNERSQLKQDNKNYIRELAQKNNSIQSLERDNQRLEIQLIPLKIGSLENQSYTLNIAKITQQGDLSSWHNKYGGQRQSYEELLSWEKKERNPEIKNKISAEIDRLEEIYDPRIMVPTIEQHNSICKFITKPNVPACAWGFEPPIDYDAKNVFHHLTEKIWTERARAACLLRNIRTSRNKDEVNKEELFNRLIERLDPEKEKSLFVAKMAFETYKYLTGFRPESNEVFGFEDVIEDWEQRKEEILKIGF